MGRIVSVANQKGGVGKTTTALNLSATLAAAEKKTLLVDLDPQGNSTSGLGIDKNTLPATVYEVLLGTKRIKEVTQKTALVYLDLVPANTKLFGAEVELVDIQNRERILRDSLEEIKGTYDYILVDCPPSLTLLTINALAAADLVAMSRWQLARQLASQGTDISSEIAEAKWDVAKERLIQGEQTIEEISAALGYADPANFSRAFAREFQQTPSKFRRAQRQQAK